jgi:hypothetical protein
LPDQAHQRGILPLRENSQIVHIRSHGQSLLAMFLQYSA